jgi:hypothetical protein
MKRFLLKSAAFLIVAFVFYCLAVTYISDYSPGFLKKNVLYDRGSAGHMFTRLREADTIRNVDALIVGSSHAYRGFDTRIFRSSGIKAFNFGSSSQTPIQSSFLLEKYFSKLQPEIMIWEVWPTTFSLDGVESMGDLISNMEDPFELTEMLLGANSVVAYNTFVASVMHNQFLNAKNFKEPLKRERDTYITGGFVERKVEFLKEKPADANPTTRRFLPEQIKAFENALLFLKGKGVKVFLVQAPCTKSHYQRFKNAEEMDEFFLRYVQKGLVSQYINFNHRADLHLSDSTDFHDTHHLNQNGVIKFNRSLLNDPVFQEHLKKVLVYTN